MTYRIDNIPSRPIDSAHVEWFEVDESGVYRTSATYYRRCTWAEAVGAERGAVGAPFHNEWLIEGFAPGRIAGWDALAKHLASGQRPYRTQHATEADALVAHIRKLDASIERKRALLDDLTAKRETSARRLNALALKDTTS